MAEAVELPRVEAVADGELAEVHRAAGGGESGEERTGGGPLWKWTASDLMPVRVEVGYGDAVGADIVPCVSSLYLQNGG